MPQRTYFGLDPVGGHGPLDVLILFSPGILLLDADISSFLASRVIAVVVETAGRDLTGLLIEPEDAAMVAAPHTLALQSELIAR